MNDDDDPVTLLAMLRAEHRALDEQIVTLIRTADVDQLEIARLKKRKLHLKDAIEALSDRIVPDILG